MKKVRKYNLERGRRRRKSNEENDLWRRKIDSILLLPDLDVRGSVPSVSVSVTCRLVGDMLGVWRSAHEKSNQ